MKKSLQFALGFVILCISGFTQSISGQTILLTENFAGFTGGTHATALTSDASSSLDSKTVIPGWTGSKIYSAGGEIKLGTAAATGWIETPPVDLSGNGGNYTIKFDICKFSGDVTTVQVYLNGISIGDVITPVDSFKTVQITGSGGTATGKIKIAALTKRFFLDNLSIISDLTTGVPANDADDIMIRIFPVPATSELTLSNIMHVNSIELFDITGKVVYRTMNENSPEIRIRVSDLKQGIYFVRFSTGKVVIIKRFIKS